LYATARLAVPGQLRCLGWEVSAPALPVTHCVRKLCGTSSEAWHQAYALRTMANVRCLDAPSPVGACGAMC